MFRHYGTVSSLSFHDFFYIFRLNWFFPSFPLRSNSTRFFGLGFLIGASFSARISNLMISMFARIHKVIKSFL
jgi:hypothetical protein